MIEYPINFNLNKSEYCCGLFELGGFSEAPNVTVVWGRPELTKKSPKLTEKEVFEKFEVDLANRLEQYISGDNGYRGSYSIFCTLVSKYGDQSTGQLDSFRAYLERTGWTIVHTFVNGNSGNTVKMYSRLIPEEEVTSLRGYSAEDDNDF